MDIAHLMQNFRGRKGERGERIYIYFCMPVQTHNNTLIICAGKTLDIPLSSVEYILFKEEFLNNL